MRNVRPLLIAVPAFLLGCLVAAGLTSTAQAHFTVVRPKQTSAPPLPKYRIATDEGGLNKYAAQGYEVKDSNPSGNYVE